MAEYIEREAIKYEQWSVGPLSNPLMVVRKKTVDSIPAADVAPVVHGRWLARARKNGVGKCCSECMTAFTFAPTPFCPNCGARMDGDP